MAFDIDTVTLRNWMQSSKGQNEFAVWCSNADARTQSELTAMIVPPPTVEELRTTVEAALRNFRARGIGPGDSAFDAVQARLDALGASPGER